MSYTISLTLQEPKQRLLKNLPKHLHFSILASGWKCYVSSLALQEPKPGAADSFRISPNTFSIPTSGWAMLIPKHQRFCI